ncbi:MAG: hypothetical protein HY863_12580 [Chloroflexi bacterium]|nr:hypothetical protein [Chloroflexota bacterium]
MTRIGYKKMKEKRYYLLRAYFNVCTKYGVFSENEESWQFTCLVEKVTRRALARAELL